MKANGDFGGSMGIALKSPSVAGRAMKFPSNRYTQTEAIRALTVADPPTTELVLRGRYGW